MSSSVALVERQVLIGANQRNRSQRSEGDRDSFPGKTKCVIVDDLASTRSTPVGAAETQFKLDAREVHAVFTHPAMNVDAEEPILGVLHGHLPTSEAVPRATQPRLQTI